MTESNFQKLFKTLVDLTISKRSDEIQKNQYKNFLILASMIEYLIDRGKNFILKNIYDWSKLKQEVIFDENTDPFSDEWIALSCLYRILSYNKNFIDELKNTNEIVYNKIVKILYEDGYIFTDFWNLFEHDINNAIKKFKKNALSRDYMIILNKYYPVLEKNILINVLEEMLENVPEYDGYSIANDCINTLITILQNKRDMFQQEDLENIFRIIDKNRQFYDKSRTNRDHQLLNIKKLGYEFSKFKNLEI